MKASNRVKRYLEFGRKVAETSNFHDYRHGAVLVRGKSIISSSPNKNSHARFGRRFRKRNHGHATHHAEIGCILGLDRSVTKGSTVYVVRLSKTGEFKMSKPCEMCHEALKYVGVRKVVYTVDDQSIGSYKL